MNSTRLLLISMASTLVLVTGCSSTPVVGYGDPQAVETLTIDFGSTDLQMISEKMVSSLLTSGVLQNRPTMTVSTLRNKTSEYIDMDNIVNSIQTQLIKSGQVRFVRSTQEMHSAIEELERQNVSGYYDPSKTAAIGRMIGARYMLEGELNSIVKAGSRGAADVYYKFTLKLIDTELGIIEWMEEQDIRKTRSRK